MKRQNQNSISARTLVFPSELGWMVMTTQDDSIVSLKFGYPSAAAAKKSMQGDLIQWSIAAGAEKNWIAELQNYAAGKPADLSRLPVDESGMTEFQKKVRQCCRRLKAGQVLTYAQLAQRAGSPGAARAVGTVMSRNKTPLIMPCHRVIGAANLGGFSAPQGLEMKRRLLRMEGCQI